MEFRGSQTPVKLYNHGPCHNTSKHCLHIVSMVDGDDCNRIPFPDIAAAEMACYLCCMFKNFPIGAPPVIHDHRCLVRMLLHCFFENTYE